MCDSGFDATPFGCAGGVGSITASDVTSDGPSTVQADLTALLLAVPTGAFKAVTSWAEFAALSVESPAGTWTIDQPIWAAGLIIAPAGAKVIGGENFAVAALLSSGVTFVFDVDDSAMSGPLVISDVVMVQNNVGVNSACIDISSTMGRTPVIQRSQFIGGTAGVKISNVGGVAVVNDCSSVATTRGVIVSGSVGGISISRFAVNNGLPGMVAIEVDATAIFSANGGLVASDATLALVAGQFGFAISNTATFSGTSLAQISGAGNIGPQENMLRQDPGDMLFDDDRLVIKGGASISDWQATGIAVREDPSDPLIVDVLLVNTDTIIPYEDALGNTEIVASTESHFTFFKNAVDPLDWYWEYTGPISNVTVQLGIDLVVDRSAGSGLARVKWQRDEAPGYVGFVDVPNSSAIWENTNALTPRTAGSTSDGTNTNDRFRPVMQNNLDAVDIRVSEVVTRVSVQS